MTFQQQIQVVDEDVLQTLSSQKGLLIGYSLEEYPDIFPSHHAVIKFINELPVDERRRLHDDEVIIYKNKISPKDTVYGDEDYVAIKGEVIETTEHLQFNRKNKQWK